MDALNAHTPSDTVKERAQAAGIDLDALKRSDPQRYKMLNAEAIVTLDPPLAEMATSVFLAAFPHYEVFKLGGERLKLVSFPPLTAAEQLKFDDALARLAAHPRYAAQHAYFRIVTDKTGEQRQFALPVLPSSWHGQADVLVGPFAGRTEAEAWRVEHVNDPALTADEVPQGGAWFVDVFASS